MEDFWDVVEYMIVTPDGQVVNDLFKVRAIFRWIVSYDIMNIDTDVLPPDGSPLEYFLKIQCEIGDHAHLFYTMCSCVEYSSSIFLSHSAKLILQNYLAN